MNLSDDAPNLYQLWLRSLRVGDKVDVEQSTENHFSWSKQHGKWRYDVAEVTRITEESIGLWCVAFSCNVDRSTGKLDHADPGCTRIVPRISVSDAAVFKDEQVNPELFIEFAGNTAYPCGGGREARR